MLRIKGGVDLKELEKFGFKSKYDEDTGNLVEMYRINGDKKGTTITMIENFSNNNYRDFWHVFAWNRRICNHGYKLNLESYDYDVLYDLITAGLVEKVEEK